MNIYTLHIHHIYSTYYTLYIIYNIICYILDEGTRAHAPKPIIIYVVDSDMAVMRHGAGTPRSGPNGPRFGRFGEITSIKIMYPRTAVKWVMNWDW